MIAQVEQVGQSGLREYALVSSAFEVRSVMAVVQEATPLSRLTLASRTIAEPWVKDYDAVDGGPLSWPARFDVRSWTFFLARLHGRVVGGAAVLYGAADLIGDRGDVALLWDIRVAPDARHSGVGRSLMGAAEAWARSQEARWLEVETQDINVPACRFYAACRFELRAANRGAYPELPNEIQLLWYKQLAG